MSPSATDLPALVDEFLMLVSESADYHSIEEVKSILREATQVLAAIRRRLAVASDRYVVAVVGLSNVGKSTLLNALLGAELAPRRNGPCTAAPIEFAYGEEFRVIAYHRRGLTRPDWRCENVEAIHKRLELLADEGNDGAGHEFSKIVVEAPLKLLSNHLVIADTPGFGAAQAGEAEGSHEASLKSYLQKQVSQVFWVVLAEQGIGKREKTFYEAFFAQVCDDVVVTGCEDWEDRDRERFRRRFADAFGQRKPRFHFVSGLQGAAARRRNDQEALERAGIRALEQRISELSDLQGRTAAIEADLLQLAEDLRRWLSDFRDSRRSPPSVWWRPDSWSRWRACLPDDAWKLRITAQLGGCS